MISMVCSCVYQDLHLPQQRSERSFVSRFPHSAPDRADMHIILLSIFLSLTSGCLVNGYHEVLSEGSRERDESDFIPDEETWRLVVLPDTQCYSERFPDVLRAQVDWIIYSVEPLAIRFVAHVGDIVNSSTPEQWQVAQEHLSRLTGHVPFVLVPGNHDFENGCAFPVRQSPMDEYFTFNDFGNEETLGGMYQDSIWNTYHLFSGLNSDWLIIGLEYGPRDAVLDWANTIVGDHSERNAIIVTHGYLYGDGTRYDHISRSEQIWSPHDCSFEDRDINDGQQIWAKLITMHTNIRFVLCGHYIGANGTGGARSSSRTSHGNTVHQLLSNYQTGSICPDEGNDGQGYLRVMEFRDNSDEVRVLTYSPWLDRLLIDPENEFTLKL